MSPSTASSRCACALVVTALLLLLSACSAQDDQSTYPEKVHRLVVAKLRHRGGAEAPLREGTWGTWEPWSPCSRSCGGGVSTQSRDCVTSKRSRVRSGSGGGHDSSKRCVGRYKRFQHCNAQPCPGLPQDFRKQQCEAYNRMAFNERTYHWEPYYEPLTPCALNCRAVGLSFYATLNRTVIDGTPCGPTTTGDICVAGKCMTVGCDGILGSGHLEDQCGVCGGNNTTCRVVSGTYTRSPLQPGYNLVLTLPTGAGNISVDQVAPTENALGLREPGSDYVFLGGGGPTNGSYLSYAEAAGVTFGYTRANVLLGDSLSSRGPLLHPLDVVLFYNGGSHDVQYRYQLPVTGATRHLATARSHQLDNPLNPLVPGGPASRNPLTGPVNDARSAGVGVVDFASLEERETKRKHEERKKKKEFKSKNHKNTKDPTKKNRRNEGPYEWKVAGFTPCSKTCGGGVHATHVECVRGQRRTHVPEQNCYAVPRPPAQTVRCNLKPCPPEWGADEWEPCSVTCGLGVQTRRLTCRQTISDNTDIVLPDSACTEPATIPRAQVCERPACGSGPQWEVGDWGDCSTNCGLGTRNRRVTCMISGKNIPYHHCSQPRPSDQEICDLGSCATNMWFFSTWEDRCSADCGTGHEMRRVYCNADPVEDKPNCNQSSQPNDTRACTSDKGCGGQWFTGDWSSCDARCGEAGQQHRHVLCVTWGRRRYKISPNETPCRSQPRPESLRVCTEPCEAQWFTSHWSQCSVTCGGGVQRREVKCLDDQQRSSLLCLAAAKPDTRQTCETQSCHKAPDESTRLEILDDPLESDGRGPPYTSALIDRPTRHEEEKEEESNAVLAAASRPRESLVSAPSGWCMDRMKNCHLVYKARLCRLKYYSKLCCRTCDQKPTVGG